MDLALDRNDSLHQGGGRAPTQSGGWIVFDGHEYANPAEMPVDVRIMYDRMLSSREGASAPPAPRRASGAARILHADLRTLQADLQAALAPARSSGNGVVYVAGAVTALVYAVWFLV